MRQICIILFISFIFGAISFLPVAVQAQSSFDLVNLKSQNLADITAYENIKITDAWDFLEQNPTLLTPVSIGIFDTGIDLAHPEFDDVPIITSSSIDHNEGGHGTQVAGIIGANNISFDSPYIPKHMNGILSGVRGLDYILQVRRTPAFFGFDLQDGFRNFAILDELARFPGGLDIINASFGGPLCSELSPLQIAARKLLELSCINAAEFSDYTDILSDLVSQYPDVLFVFGAGNEGIDAQFNLPGGGINAPNIISVSATDLNDERADFFIGSSNFGSSVDISAPGLNIYAPQPGNGYDEDFGGTSAAAPMVTGVAGLLKAIDPSLTPAQIKSILISTADPITTDKPIGGRLNALAAVQAVLPPVTTECSDGIDNDGDGLIDLDDPGCVDAQDDDEFDAPPTGGPPISCPLSGTITSDATIPLSESPCVIQSITIPTGATLTIDPGVVIKFINNNSQFIVEGTLNANGTLTQPIFFTSIKDDSVGGDTNGDLGATTPAAANWRHIILASGSTAHFSHSTIRFGGRFNFGVLQMNGDTLSFSNGRVTQNAGRNILMTNGTTTIVDSEIDNAGIGILQTGGSLTVSGSSVHDNSTGASSVALTAMDARNNWWGSSSGPFHPTLNPFGLGNAVSDNILFIPFLSADPVGNLP